jgi:hypothetical protein
MHLGTLAGDLGCFPLDAEVYPPATDSPGRRIGLRSLPGFGNLVGPLDQTVALQPTRNKPEAIPKYISERTRYH